MFCSIAGLLAARALAGYFEQVTLVERDTFPAPGENRKGVPQGKHTHVLLQLGREIIEDFLPGLTERLAQLEAAYIKDVSRDARWSYSGGYHKPSTSGVSGLGVTHPTLEAKVRSRVLALPNIRTVDRCSVLGLGTITDRSRVTGVRLKNRRGGGSEERITADLVLDASGRGSISPAWLEELGYTRPADEDVRIGMGYTTFYYRREPEHLPGILVIT